MSRGTLDDAGWGSTSALLSAVVIDPSLSATARSPHWTASPETRHAVGVPASFSSSSEVSSEASGPSASSSGAVSPVSMSWCGIDTVQAGFSSSPTWVRIEVVDPMNRRISGEVSPASAEAVSGAPLRRMSALRPLKSMTSDWLGV